MRRSREQAAQLERYGIELEERVAERTMELRQALEQLQASMEIIRQVGTPVLPIQRGVLLAPVIGMVDNERMRQLQDRVLHGIGEHHTRVVLLDITGVPVVDSAVADALLKISQSVRLLGATPVLVGIRAEVAQTMVNLGVDLRKLVTCAGLQEGLQYAQELLGVHRAGTAV